MAKAVPGSPTLLDRALKVTPGGAQTRSKRPDRFPWDPKFLTHGEGAYVWDTEGKKYIDWICGLGAISLGYQYHSVDSYVKQRLQSGVSFSLPTDLEIEVSEHACAILMADQIRWVKTGSEATEGAMRIARLATGRDVVIQIGYHGWHSVHDASLDYHMGVPEVYEEVNWGHPFGKSLDPMAEWGIKPAAVLVEPCRDEEPPKGYLRGLKDWCAERGSLLIFDECVTGFRWAVRGASEFFHIEPDLRVYGKGMANGYPLACIVGPKELMKHAEYVSGTFGGETLSLAAAQATMTEYRLKYVIPQMWHNGRELIDGVNRLGGAVRMEGYPVHPRIVGDRRDDFIRLVADEGVLFHPSGFNVSYSHRDKELTETLEACERAMERL